MRASVSSRSAPCRPFAEGRARAHGEPQTRPIEGQQRSVSGREHAKATALIGRIDPRGDRLDLVSAVQFVSVAANVADGKP